MIRLRSLAAAVLAAGVLALPLTACTDSSTAEHTPDAGAHDGTTPSLEVSTPANPSVPTVAGPSPVPNPDVPETAPAEALRSCGQTAGPDGALQVHVMEGDISCDDVADVLDGYDARMRTTGADHDVDGWTCGPARVEGELFRCAKDGTIIALTP